MILANMIFPIFLLAPFFFALISPLVIFFEFAVFKAYFKITNVDASKAAVLVNIASFAISVFFIAIAEEFSYFLRRDMSYEETLIFMAGYRAISVVTLYVLTVIIEWFLLLKILRKTDSIKLLAGSLIANAVSYLISVPIFYSMFFQP